MINFFKKLFGSKPEFKKEKPVIHSTSKTPPEVKESPSICPYCQKELKQKPKRKKKCPFCDNYIYVKQRPNSEIKELVTEEEKRNIEAEWNKIHNYNALIRDIEDYGFTEKEFNCKKDEKKKQIGKEPKDGDVIWALFNEKLHKTMKTKNFAELSGIYYDMSRFQIKDGRNPHETLKQSQKMKLLDYQQQEVKKVEILWSGNGCDSCKKLNGKKYSIQKALEEMPLPNTECSMDVFEKGFPWCRCDYTPII